MKLDRNSTTYYTVMDALQERIDKQRAALESESVSTENMLRARAKLAALKELHTHLTNYEETRE